MSIGEGCPAIARGITQDCIAIEILCCVKFTPKYLASNVYSPPIGQFSKVRTKVAMALRQIPTSQKVQHNS